MRHRRAQAAQTATRHGARSIPVRRDRSSRLRLHARGVHIARRAGGLMPRSIVGLLAAIGATMFALAAFAHGDLTWLTIADGAAATGLVGYLTAPATKKGSSTRQTRQTRPNRRIRLMRWTRVTPRPTAGPLRLHCASLAAGKRAKQLGGVDPELTPNYLDGSPQGRSLGLTSSYGAVAS